MKTKKKRPTKRKPKTVYTRDEIDAKIQEVASRINTTNERTPLGMPTLDSTMREIERDDRRGAPESEKVDKMRVVIEGFVDKRLTAYFDAHLSQYADVHNLVGIRGRIAALEQWKSQAESNERMRNSCAPFELSEKDRLKSIELWRERMERWVSDLSQLGFFGRLKVLFFGFLGQR